MFRIIIQKYTLSEKILKKYRSIVIDEALHDCGDPTGNRQGTTFDLDDEIEEASGRTWSNPEIRDEQESSRSFTN